jgi:hypothetical protein
LQALLAQLAQLATQDDEVLLVTTAPQAVEATAVQLATRVTLAKPVNQVATDDQVPQALKAIRVQLARTVLTVFPEPQANKVLQVNEANKALEVTKVKQARTLKTAWATWLLPESRVSEANKDKTVPQVTEA